MISIRQLNKAYVVGDQLLPVLIDLDLEVETGELVSIMGTSGSGKSTLLNVIGVLDSFDSGTYTLAGTPIGNLSDQQAARLRSRTIGFVFQSFNLLGTKTAAENVALPLYYQGVPRRERLARAAAMLARVGLSDRVDHTPNQLSGGQKQRVAIARALVSEPSLILADEPTGALDSTTGTEVMDLLLEVNAEGITTVVVTHDAEVARRTRRIIHLKDGRVVAPSDAGP